METVEVTDISVYREGILHSLWEQQLVKDGKLEKIGMGFGMVKGGKLYRFRAVVLVLEEAGIDTCLKVTFRIPVEGCLAKLQIKDANYPDWMDYEHFYPENGKAIIRDANGGSIASGTYRVVVTDTTDYSEIYSNEVTYETAIPLRLLCANNCILMVGEAGNLVQGSTIKSNDVLYTLQIYNERYEGWSATPNKLIGTGEPIVWSNLKGGKYRLVGENIETEEMFGSNAVTIRPLDQLVLCETVTLDHFVFNGDLVKQLVRNGEGFEDFSLSFVVGGTDMLYDRVVLKRFEVSLLEWQEVRMQDIVMETTDTNVSGEFTVNVPGCYRAEAVNNGTGAKTESNFVVLNEPV